MMFKGLLTVLGRCGSIKANQVEYRRSIDSSNAQYSKEFKSDRVHAETEKEVKQLVPKEMLRIDMHRLATPGSEGVKRFKEEQSARENTLCRRKCRQFRIAFEHPCGIGGYDHAI